MSEEATANEAPATMMPVITSVLARKAFDERDNSDDKDMDWNIDK